MSLGRSLAVFDPKEHPRQADGRWKPKPGGFVAPTQLATLRSDYRPAFLSDLDPSTPLTAVRFAVLDNETTGLDTALDQVVQVAVCECDGDGIMLDQWDTYVRPDGERLDLDGAASGIHRIPRRLITGAPSFSSVAPKLAARLDGAVMVAHNVDFDFDMLGSEFKRAGWRMPDTARLCTRNLARLGSPGAVPFDHHNLGYLCERYGLELRRAHRADGDAAATAALLPILLERAGCHTVGDLTSSEAFSGDALTPPTRSRV